MRRVITCTELEDIVRGMLKESRFVHSQGVAKVSSALSARFLGSPEPGYMAGIFHDAYRYMDGRDALKLCKRKKAKTSKFERENPVLLHGLVAALNFRKVAGPVPDSYLKAVRHHTLGSVSMGVLGACVYVADYIEPGRKHISAEDKDKIFNMPTLEGMVFEILTRERKYAKEVGRKVAPRSQRLYSFLKKGGKFEK